MGYIDGSFLRVRRGKVKPVNFASLGMAMAWRKPNSASAPKAAARIS